MAVFGPNPILTVTIEARGHADDVHVHAGGQGVWVARMVAELGAHPMLCGFAGGETGHVLERLLEHLPGERRLVPSAGSSGCYVMDRRPGERTLVAQAWSPAPSRRDGPSCSTPHIRHDHDVRIDELAWRVEELNGELALRGLRARVVPGGEVAETISTNSTTVSSGWSRSGRPGAGSSSSPAPDRCAIARPCGRAARGYRSVIAHPERHLTPDLRCGWQASSPPERSSRGPPPPSSTPEAHPSCSSWPGAASCTCSAATPTPPISGARSGSLTRSNCCAARGPPPARSTGSLLRGARPAAGEIDWIARVAPAAIVAGEPVAPPFAPYAS